MPDPKIEHPRDAIIRVTSCAICGSDLDIFDGVIPGMEHGEVLGHETMGDVVEVGSENKKLKSATAWWALQGHRSSDLDAPLWLWTSIVDLVGAHEKAYLDHSRRGLPSTRTNLAAPERRPRQPGARCSPGIGAPCDPAALALAHWPSIYHPYGWFRDGEMAEKTSPRAADSEKLTINVGYVDLGHIDLLVREGFYSNRSDFIRAAIRTQLDRHTDAVKQSVARRQLDLGLRQYSRFDLEAIRAAGETLHIQVLGLAVIASDVSADLARATIASIQVLGALQASPEVKAALSDRIR